MSICTYDFYGLTLDVEFDYRVGCEAKIYGPAEECYPAEDAEIEVTGISCKGEALETNDLYMRIGGNYFWIDTIISDYICENIETILGE
jgi:hypothetical protein